VREHALAQDRARADVVYQDAIAPDLVRQALGERDHAHAGGAGERQVGDRLVHRAREDIDDAPAALALEGGQGLARHPREEQQRALHGDGPLLFRCVVGAGQGWAPELLTMMSMRPKRVTVAAIRSWTVSWRSRSPGNARTSAPVASRISLAAFSRSLADRLQSATFTPS